MYESMNEQTSVGWLTQLQCSSGVALGGSFSHWETIPASCSIYCQITCTLILFLPPYLSLSLSLPVSETPLSDIEDSFKSFINRPDIAIILINQNVCHMMSHDSHMTDASLLQIAEMIRHLLDAYDKPIPSVLEIPSKDHPYDPSKDGILRRAKVSYSSTDGLMSPFHLHPCSLFPSSPSSLSHPVLSLPLLPPHRVCSMLMTSVSPTHWTI